jgi:MarR family transcriptional regulator, transcriptional regulator for hemolysin
MAKAQSSSNVTHELDAPPWQRFESTLMATSRSIRRAYDIRLEAIGLNLSEACLLAYVVENGPLTQTQVAERIGMGRATAGTIVDKLSADSLLVRLPDPDDRRVWLLSATPGGVELADRISDADHVLRADLRIGLSRAERQQLATTLVALQSNLQRVIESHAGDADQGSSSLDG